jgi:hypothetical protein
MYKIKIQGDQARYIALADSVFLAGTGSLSAGASTGGEVDILPGEGE